MEHKGKQMADIGLEDICHASTMLTLRLANQAK